MSWRTFFRVVGLHAWVIRSLKIFAYVLCLTCYLPLANAGEVTVAVAANFARTLEQIGPGFTAETGHTLKTITGSTGLLYAQLQRGAPFDVFLAADAERPAKLVAAGLANKESLFTYALGRLALWQPTSDSKPDLMALQSTLGSGRSRDIRFAIANPRLAPYGSAAKAVLAHMGLANLLNGNVVFGQNIGSTYALVASGNVTAGFVALSQLLANEIPEAQYQIVDASLHPPIAQHAVLTSHGNANIAAKAFLTYLRSDVAQSVIVRAGYLPTAAANDGEEDEY